MRKTGRVINCGSKMKAICELGFPFRLVKKVAAMILIEWFVRNPVKVSVSVILVALFGTIALCKMPMQLTPEVEVPTITVTTMWPGASPQEVESEIIQEIGRAHV